MSDSEGKLQEIGPTFRREETQDADEPCVKVGKERMEGPNKLTQWSEVLPNTYLAVSYTQKSLDPGVYSLDRVNAGPVFKKEFVKFDDLIDFKDSVSHNVLEEIVEFWKSGLTFKKYGFLHRRGYLLYGPPGSGKSCLVYMIINRIVEAGGVVILCHCYPSTIDDCLYNLRMVEPERNIVCVFEDIEALMKLYGQERILSLLDGESQVDRVLNIATTNYPELLDRRIVSRPRRFDRLLRIDMPGENVRREYFKKKLQISNREMDEWVEASEGFSFAAMADLVISVKCLKNSFGESVKKLRELLDKEATSHEYFGKKVGF